MAQNPPCMIEECEQLATFTGTFFETGQSIIVCGSHFDDFAAAMLESSTGIPVTALILMDPATFATDEPEDELFELCGYVSENDDDVLICTLPKGHDVLHSTVTEPWFVDATTVNDDDEPSQTSD